MTKQLEALTSTVGQLSAQVQSVITGLGQVSADVKQLTTATADVASLRIDFRQFLEQHNKQLERRPSLILEHARNVFAILQAGAFLVGAAVACIVYVSSNANNAELAVMKFRLEQAEKVRDRELAQSTAWATSIEKHASAEAPRKR
jgi:hypothetical protein